MQYFHRLVVTRALPAAIEHRADTSYAVHRWSREPGSWASTVRDADALLCGPADTIDATAIAALPPSVRVIGTFSVGYEHIDLPAATARGIAVVNTPGVLSRATAEFTMLLILAAARRAGEGERLLRAGQWAGWSPAGLLGMQVSGKSLGIFGMGRIGQTVAAMARGFAMPIHYRNRTRVPEDQAPAATWHQDDASFLGACDILALCAPSTPQTRHWLNAGRIAQLRPGAIVVNTSRGNLVDDAALIDALGSGHVAAAGLDVFANEPEVPAGYLRLENVVLTPHMASATAETREAMGHLVLDGIAAVLAGKAPGNLLNQVPIRAVPTSAASSGASSGR